MARKNFNISLYSEGFALSDCGLFLTLQMKNKNSLEDFTKHKEKFFPDKEKRFSENGRLNAEKGGRK